MAWDKTFPTASTKIRNLSTGIPNNWDAIETADSTFIPEALNLLNRASDGGLSNDPTAIADTVILYSKEDSNGDAQLYAIDPSSNITQLTQFSTSEASNGSMTFPGGLTFIWGQTTGTTGSKTFHTAFANNIFNLQVSMIAAGAAYGSQKNQSITGFDWTVSGTPSAIQYFAIGN